MRELAVPLCDCFRPRAVLQVQVGTGRVWIATAQAIPFDDLRALPVEASAVALAPSSSLIWTRPASSGLLRSCIVELPSRQTGTLAATANHTATNGIK